ncbi:MAU2 chromatid cohesion factor homolog [Eurytemora carolleeae]|uniref:MAU2 chromatid cohesion factor homolog n=1 Tax=Eurytemora carolleeae TaxID=1294199 RepID=UPI000C7680D2|nr:MAU2 chromatid cohesion factor homolog [Eurytemora carolleeae]|eukprot:XP_023321486.1 MAU2 chromatid cohesion factor homolog [Eurytemora affinis]
MSGDMRYPALLAMAEQFRLKNNMKESIRCLHAVFSLNPSPDIEARTHLQLGNMLRLYSNNLDLAKHHLEQSWYQGQNVQPDQIMLEAASVLAKMYEKEGNTGNCKQILDRALQLSSNNPHWNSRLLFQAAQLHISLKDYLPAYTYLQAGIDYCGMNSRYTRCLFILSKTMLFLSHKKFNEANPLLQMVSPEIENWVASATHQDQSLVLAQKEYLQIFYLVLQVCYYLMVGQVKSSKMILKQLQGSILTVTSPDFHKEANFAKDVPEDQFMWLSHDQLCILVYLITVMHSMQGGNMDKAEKYTEKAIQQIQKQQGTQENSLISFFHVMLVEHIIQCRIVQGKKEQGIRDIGVLCTLLEKNPLLLQNHRSQLHTLIGLYAMSQNCLNEAETQFNAALRTTRETELWTFANLNLAIVYLRSNRLQEFQEILPRISPDNLPSSSHCLKAAAYFVHGMNAYYTNNVSEAKRCLRETLKMSTAEDLNRLLATSLALLGHVFLSQG